MATYTDNGTNTPNGSHKVFTYTFPALQTEDIKVALNGVAQATTKYTASLSPSQIEFNNTSIDSSVQESTGAPKTGVVVRVFRETTVGKNSGDEDPKAVFAAGSSIRAADLNANQEQALFAIHELQTQPIKTSDVEDDAIISSKILDGTIVEGNLANSAVTQNKLANNSVGTPELINGSITGAKIANDTITAIQLANNSADINVIVDGAVSRAKIAADAIDGTKLADDSIDSEHYVAGSIDNEHLASDSISSHKVQDDAIDSEHIAAGALDNEHYAAGSITADKLNSTTVVINSEQASHNVNDTSFFTTAAAEARYFNASTGETIKDGQSFPDNDTTIATTAAINDRIIDLVDDVGGFVPIANETSFPTSNPDINTSGSAKGGTIVSVKTASTNLVPSGTTVTIANGRGSGLAVIITGVSATIPSGFGFLVETTTTDHTYAFHRLSPNATEVTTVAGKATEVTTVHTNITSINAVASDISNVNAVAADATDIGAVAAKATEIGRLGTADAVADMAILGTADVVADLNTLGTADVVADMNMLATSDVVADMNMLAVSDVISDMNDLATSGNITAMSTCSTNIASINNASTNISSVNNFGDTYQVSANDPTTDGGGNTLAEGDLYFNTSADRLKVYNGSSWVNGVEISGSGAVTTGNTFTGDNRYNDGVKALFGTGSDLEIVHDGNNSVIQNNTGITYIKGLGGSGNTIWLQPKNNESSAKFNPDAGVELFYDHSKKFETVTNGISIGGRIEFTDTNSIITRPTGSALSIETGGTERLRVNSSGNVKLPDNGKLQFGGALNSGDGDLQIYHDGSSSYIKDNSNQLYIRANAAIKFENDAGSETFAKFHENGNCELYHDNSKKLETTSAGVTVTGNIAVSGTVDGVDIAALNTTVGNISTDLVNDSSPQLGGDLDTNSHNISLDDDHKIKFGDSADLTIEHTGNNDHIESGGSGFFLDSVGNQTFRTNSHANMAKFIPTGAVELYHDGTKKFETSSNGVTISGNPTINGTTNANGHVKLPDHTGSQDAQVTLGTGNDLLIYHDGSNSYVKNNTSNLVFTNCGTDSKSISFYGDSGLNENLAHFIQGGAAELYYDNSKKLHTVAGGVVTTGYVSIEGGSNGQLYVEDNGKVNLGSSQDLQIYHDGTKSYIDNNTGDLEVHFPTRIELQSNNGSEVAARFIGDGAVELFYDHTKRFETTSTGVQVTGNIDIDGNIDAADGSKLKLGTGDDLQIYHNGTNDFIQSNGGYLKVQTDDLRINDRSNDHAMIEAALDGAVKLYYDNSLKLYTIASGCQINDSNYFFYGSDGDGYNYHNGSAFYTMNNTGIYYFGNVSNESVYFRTNNTNRFHLSNAGHVIPNGTNTYDLGESANRWRNIYTNDLHLSNEGHSNDVDGTWGDWTIQEGESDLFLKNNRSGKKYKFNLTEVS